eukprot:331431-Rhodomonas_salina.2
MADDNTHAGKTNKEQGTEGSLIRNRHDGGEAHGCRHALAPPTSCQSRWRGRSSLQEARPAQGNQTPTPQPWSQSYGKRGFLCLISQQSIAPGDEIPAKG